MQPTPHTDEADLDTTSDALPARRRGYRRLIVLFCLLVFILLLTFIPPLLNMSRFQQRIAHNISASVGRPVHFNSVALNLLPIPGFTLNQFVVDEDPAYGFEPILFASTVRADLRLSSLWRHAEFSKITLTDPSVNLVRAPNGHWNIEAILLQASRIQAAPTAQTYSSPARRFPYIEASGARLNLKLGPEKTPFSLTEADFALSLPEPHQWNVRLVAHPTRTDTAPGETGIVRIEGTLGRANIDAASLADIPIDLHGDWRDAQLGGLSNLVFANDSGLRGDLALAFTIRGTVGESAIATSLKLAKARRADFVPNRMFSLDAACSANARNSFQSFTAIECHWPPADTSDRSFLILTADLPDVRHPRSATIDLTVPALPAATFFGWLNVATPHAPNGAGTLAGSLAFAPEPTPPAKSGTPQPAAPSTWTGELEFSMGSIELDRLSHRSIPLSDVVLRSTSTATPSSYAHKPAAAPAPDSFDLLPVTLPLGGKQPATLEGHIDDTGYTLHLTGTVIRANLLELSNAVPQIGEGLQELLDKIAPAAPDSVPPDPAAPDSTKPDSEPDPSLSSVPIHLDITATRAWGSPQVWRETTPSPLPRRSRR